MYTGDGEAVKHQRSARPPEDASVFIQAHHVGCIDWDPYQRHQDVMRNNGGNLHEGRRVARSAVRVRCGQRLLSGLLRCGRTLHIRYWGKSGTATRYLCSGDFATGGAYGLGFGGATRSRAC